MLKLKKSQIKDSKEKIVIKRIGLHLKGKKNKLDGV